MQHCKEGIDIGRYCMAILSSRSRTTSDFKTILTTNLCLEPSPEEAHFLIPHAAGNALKVDMGFPAEPTDKIKKLVMENTPIRKPSYTSFN